MLEKWIYFSYNDIKELVNKNHKLGRPDVAKLLIKNGYASSGGGAAIVSKYDLNIGDMVKIVKGAFENMYGKISKIDIENQLLEIVIDLFGQETSVELGFTDIQKA